MSHLPMRSRPVPGAKGPRAATVLVVEDDPTTAELVRHVLESQGCAVVLSRTGREGLERASAEEPHAVVLDLGLPDLDGRLLLKELRRIEGVRECPVLILSGSVGPGVKAECFAYGADVFLEKPVDPSALVGAVSSLLEPREDRPASPDPLWELPGPEGLNDRFNQLQAGRTRTGAPVTFALLEVGVGNVGGTARDGEELVGAGKGHQVRALLGRVAAALAPHLAAEDVLAQWGMAELILLAPGRPPQEIVGILEEVRGEVPAEGEVLSAGVTRPAAETTLLEAVGEGDHLLAGFVGVPGGGVVYEKTPSPPPRRVVVAEDDLVTAALLRHHLERGGLAVEHRGNGREAFELIRSAPPALVILDIQLPGMNGLELLARMKGDDELREVRVIVLTSLAGDVNVGRAFHLGADDYVVKPFSPGELMARALRLLRRA